MEKRMLHILVHTVEVRGLFAGARSLCRKPSCFAGMTTIGVTLTSLPCPSHDTSFRVDWHWHLSSRGKYNPVAENIGDRQMSPSLVTNKDCRSGSTQA